MTELKRALLTERTIDIVTVGAKSGLKRVTEIWFTNIQGRIIICGTPSSDGLPGKRKGRDWLANLKANPAFDFCFKGTVNTCLPAIAVPVVDLEDRRHLMGAAETSWYRDQEFSVGELASGAPIVDVLFSGEYHYLNANR